MVARSLRAWSTTPGCAALRPWPRHQRQPARTLLAERVLHLPSPRPPHTWCPLHALGGHTSIRHNTTIMCSQVEAVQAAAQETTASPPPVLSSEAFRKLCLAHPVQVQPLSVHTALELLVCAVCAQRAGPSHMTRLTDVLGPCHQMQRRP